MQSPIRRDDLIHSEAALRKTLEIIIWLGRLALSTVELVPPLGYLIRPRELTGQLRDWLTSQKSSPRLWMDASTLDDLGSQLFVPREPCCLCLGLAAWQDATSIANLLRVNHIGPILWETYKTTLLDRVVEELKGQFGLIKRALNSRETSAYAKTEWGILVTLKPEQGLQLFEYFCLPAPKDLTLPIVAKLGGNISSVTAFGPETVRLGLCFNGFEGPACLALQDWLQNVHQPVSAT
jgi:hypothetical protein